jgi:hypothetical protein
MTVDGSNLSTLDQCERTSVDLIDTESYPVSRQAEVCVKCNSDARAFGLRTAGPFCGANQIKSI